MPKLLDQRTAIRLLQKDGWTQTVGGKYVVKMVKDGRRPVTLPHNHGESYGKGLSSAIGLYLWDIPAVIKPTDLTVGRTEIDARPASSPTT